MNGFPRIWRVVVLGMVLLLAVAACGGDDVADPERFCEINAQLDERVDPMNLPPDEAREAMPETRNLLAEAQKVAPDEIRPSVVIVVDSLTVIYDALEAADFDFEQIAPGAIPDEFFEETSEIPAASDTLEQWTDANCST